MTEPPDERQTLVHSEPFTGAMPNDPPSADALPRTTSNSQEEPPIVSPGTDLTCTASNDTPHPQIEKDKRHYYEFVKLLVEGRLFQVPTYPFDEKRSSFWKSLEPVIYHDSAVVLEDVRQKDFCALLDFLFPDPIEEKKSRNLDDWKSILELTHKWSMRKLFDQAMKALHRAPLDDQVILARKYGVFDWLKSTYIQLAGRNTFLSENEATSLGLEAVLKLADIREKRDRASSSQPAVTAMPKKTDGFGKAIMAELRKLDKLESVGRSPTVVEQVMMGRKHAVAHLVKYGYQILTDRKESISLDEGKLLGLQITRDLCHAREMAWRKNFGSGSGTRVDIAVEVAIQFEEELNQLESVNDYYGKGPPASLSPEK